MTRDWMKEIRKVQGDRRKLLLIYGPPGIGKTSLAGNIPRMLGMPVGSEDSWDLLRGHAIPEDSMVLPAIKTWNDAKDALGYIANGKIKASALVIDSVSELTSVGRDHIKSQDYGGSDVQYDSYGRGANTFASCEWRIFMNLIDKIRDQAGMNVILIGHETTATKTNATGSDYPQDVPVMPKKILELVVGWVDAVLLCRQFSVTVEEEGSTSKARTSGVRFIQTNPDPAYIAKNRFGLPDEIEMGSSGKEAWANLTRAFSDAQKNGGKK